MDGVPGYSQPHVEPGGTFTYDFIVPDAGIYWYHPHVMSAMQVGFGLYGAFLVEDPTEAETVGVDDSLVIQYTFTKVGGDGGLLEYSVEQDFLVLGAGERADVIITPRGVPGDELMLRSQLHDRGYGSTEMRTVEDLVAITIADQPEHVGGPLPEVTRAIEPFRAEGATEITLTLTIDQDPISLKFEYGINGVPYWKASPVLAELGETQIWTVENTTPWSHPLHLHGFFFMVLDEDGAPVRPYEWKDTVDVPFKQTRRLLVRFDEDRPGTWLFHCHILDHAAGGLLSTVHLGLPLKMYKPFGSH